MQLIVMFNDEPFPIFVEPPNDVNSVRLAIESLLGIPCDQQELIFNGSPLSMSGSLTIAENDILLLMKKTSGGGAAGSSRTMHLSDVPQSTTPEDLLRLCALHPNLKTQLSNADPGMYDLVHLGDIPKIRGELCFI